MSGSIEALELKIAKFLRYGVLAAGALMLIGWLALVTRSQSLTANPFVSFKVYREVPLAAQWTALREADSRAGLAAHVLCYAGLGVLISLPIIRVLLTAVLFFKQREWVLSGIAWTVLAVLLLGFSL